MMHPLLSSIRAKVEFSDEEFERLLTFFKPRKLRRKQQFLLEGEIAENLAFVLTGLLRSYTIDHDGNEKLFQFAPENYWIGDLFSSLTQTPTKLNIDALEDSELLVIDRYHQEEMYHEFPVLERYFRILTQNAYVTVSQRLMSTIKDTAEYRYIEMLDKFPGIFQRVPQKQIASYLGITPETLSRIKKRILERYQE